MSAAVQIDSLFEKGFQAHVQGDLPRAIGLYQQVLRFSPAHSSTLKAFGVLAFSGGAVEKGLELLEAATRSDPNDAEAWSNLGNALRAIERHSESADACQKAVLLNPQDGTAHSNLAAALRCLGRLSESLHHAGLAVELVPQLAEAHINLASGFQNLGETDTALMALAQASQVNPTHVATRQNLLFTSLYSDQLADEEITQMHADFGAMFPTPIRPQKRKSCRNIGFVSGDFRKHPVGRFFSSLLPHIDRSRHKVTLYANMHDLDDVSIDLSKQCDRWRAVYGVDDKALAAMVQKDEIDVLVDLSGHSAQNRMTFFALGSCAVQATWLGYSSTTGMPGMDWFLGDAVTNPADHDHLYTEKVARVADAFLCDDPLGEIPDAIPHEGIVFASFNNTAKFSPSCIDLWSRVLQAVPESTLILKYGTLADTSVQQVMKDRFKQHGIEESRLTFLGFQSHQEHRDFFRRVDLCLDTTPYTGATTTMDSLRGGGPVLTLAGRRYSSRMSASILSASGLDEFVVESEQDFVDTAVRIAKNPAVARAKVAKMAPTSPVFQPAKFATSLQDALDDIWLRS